LTSSLTLKKKKYKISPWKLTLDLDSF